jgi:ParB-like chromosome segregation protein Spo0J
MLSHGDLEMGHARALLGLPDNQQVEGARHVVARGLTVRQTEALVRQWLSGKPEPVEPANLIRISLASSSVWPSAWALRCRFATVRRAKASW